MLVDLKALGWLEVPRALLCWNTFYDFYSFWFDYHIGIFPKSLAITQRFLVLSPRIRLFSTNPLSMMYFKLWFWLDFALVFLLRLWLSHDHKVRWNGRKVQPIYYCNCTPIIWRIAKSIVLYLINSNVVKSIFAFICMSCFGVK